MNYIELLINEPATARLDLDTEVNIALQYSIADIKDISKRNSAYSKTISLPGSKKNNFWFGNLFDVNADFTAFNPNKKTTCKLIVNSDQVLSGFLQLVNIVKLNNVDQTGNQIRYECVLYNDAVDLMSELGEKTLYDLDLSEFSHIFKKETVEASWEHTWEDGYVYPIFGEQSKDYQYNLDWFYPNAFYKIVLDRIITQAGYGWTGSFKTNPQFEKEIIAFVQDGNKYIDENEARRREFRAGITADEEVFYQRMGQSTTPVIGFPLLTNSPGYKVTARYRDDSTPPNFDNAESPTNPNGSWNTSTWEWTVQQTGTYKLEWGLDYDLILENDQAVNMTTSGLLPFVVNNFHVLEKSLDNGVTWTLISSQQSAVSFLGPPTSPLGTLVAGASQSRQVVVSDDTLPQQQFVIGTKIRLSVSPRYGQNGVLLNTSPTGLGGITPLVYIKWRNSANNFIFNDAQASEIGQGSLVDLGVFLPDKLKQKDLISDLIKRYNLYIEVSSTNNKQLIFTERPNFYNDAAPVIDWTQKKDFSQEDKITLLTDLQFKEIKWSYKLDKDFANEAYERETGDVYGERSYIFDNDFVKGVKLIESPFASSPLVKTQWGAWLSSIDPQQPKILPRVLYWGGLKTHGVSWELEYIDIDTNPGQILFETYNNYPYAGHFDDALEPRLDINFGINKFYFYNEYDIIPTNNMYNNYWSDYVRQIEKGRLLTTNIYLNETDIAFIKDNFNTKIFLVDAYYYVNKITDYKPIVNEPTRVELLKIEDGIKWVNEGSAENEVISNTFSCPADVSARKKKGGWYYVSDSGLPISEECCDLMSGVYLDGVCKAVRNIRPISIDNMDVSKLKNTDGNVGWGVFNGSRNRSGGTKIISGTDSNIQIYSKNISNGNDNDLFGFNLETLGDENIINGEEVRVIGDRNEILGSQVFLQGSDNYVEANNLFSFGVQGKTFSESDSNKFFIGPDFSIDMTDGAISPGKIFLDYGTSATPSISWDDDRIAGFWKETESAQNFNAGIFGVTISTWSPNGLNMNNHLLTNFNHPTITSPFGSSSSTVKLGTGNYLYVYTGSSPDTILALPDAPSLGRKYVVKNMGTVPYTVRVGLTASQTIDGLSDRIVLETYESVSLMSASSTLWVIV